MLKKLAWILILAIAGCAGGTTLPEATSKAVERSAWPDLAAVTPTPPSTADDGNVTDVPATSAPAATSPAGWKTFTSADLALAIDYPPDWSVTSTEMNATFSSPQGASIQLASIDTGGVPPDVYLSENRIMNTRCSPQTNQHGVKVEVCFDTVSFIYNGTFALIPPAGSERLLSLTLSKRGDLDVFNGMIASVRPAT
jgi:hypothetical protein